MEKYNRRDSLKGEINGVGLPNGKGSVAWSLPHNSHERPADGGEDNGASSAGLKRARSAVYVAMPWLIWSVFVISIIVGSSSGAVILAMERAAPLSLAGWRHQISAVAMLPFFLCEWSKLSKSDRSKSFSGTTLGLLLLSSIGMTAHFAFYMWALNHTSMVHCLFLVTMAPIFVAIYTKLSGGVLLTGELVGVGLGLLGVAILASGAEVDNDDQDTLIGDGFALLASVGMAVYLVVGQKIRSWMPLFVYQFPVVLMACIILGISALLFEGWNESDVGDISGPFGWLRKEYLLGTIYLGIGPGFIGHAGYSFVLRYSSPLVMPTGLSLQPMIGSLIGWAAGEAPVPDLWTCLGGLVTLTGTLCVSYASTHRKAKAEKKEEEYRQPAIDDDEEAQQGTKPLLQSSGDS